MNSNLKSKNNSSYFKECFKNFHIITALLLTSIILTLATLNREFHVLEVYRHKSPQLSDFLTVAFCTLGFFLIISILTQLKNRRLTISDSLSFTLVFTGIGYSLFNVFLYGTTNWINLASSGIMLVLGLVFIFIRRARFNPDKAEGEIVYTKNTIRCYYATLIKKYSYFAVLATFFIILIMIVLLFETRFTTVLSNAIKANMIIKYLFYIVAGLLVFFFILASSEKKLNIFDLILFAGLIDIILSFVGIAMLGFKEISLIIWAVLFGLLLFFTFVRFLCFDLKEEEKTKQVYSYGNKRSGLRVYYKEVFSKYNILFAFVSACIVAVVAITAISSKVFTTFCTAEYLFIFLCCALLIGGGALFLLIGIFTSFASIPSVKVVFADFILFILLILGVLSLCGVAVIHEKIYLFVSVALFIFSLTASVARIRNVVIYDGKEIRSDKN